jgi:hypothetical protein
VVATCSTVGWVGFGNKRAYEGNIKLEMRNGVKFVIQPYLFIFLKETGGAPYCALLKGKRVSEITQTKAITR